MNVEVGKKETGSTEGMAMTIAEYLDVRLMHPLLVQRFTFSPCSSRDMKWKTSTW